MYEHLVQCECCKGQSGDEIAHSVICDGEFLPRTVTVRHVNSCGCSRCGEDSK